MIIKFGLKTILFVLLTSKFVNLFIDDESVYKQLWGRVLSFKPFPVTYGIVTNNKKNYKNFWSINKEVKEVKRNCLQLKTVN